jgi:poly(A) polymerase
MTPREFAIELVRKLQTAGYQALWAGGCVRDELLNREPKDYDVATDAQPDQVRQLFGLKRTIPIGAAFGVITVIGPKSAGQIEVATFRQEAHYSDGRHPDSIQFSSPQEDAQRRDFTINGMFYDPLKKQVIDFVAGQEDLRLRRIRAIGNPDHRIQEDKLRMLRAIRFAATFGFEIESQTMQAIQTAAPQINQISAERIGSELVRMLAHPSRATACRLLLESRLLVEVLPENWYQIADWRGSKLQDRLGAAGRLELEEFAPAAFLILQPSLERLQLGPPPTETAECGAVSDPVLPEGYLAGGLRQLQNCWRLTNQQRDQIGWITRHWQELAQGNQLPWSQLQPLLTHDFVDLALATAKAILGDTDGLQTCRDCLGLPGEKLNPPLLMTGEDLIRLGFKPGRHFKALLQIIRDRQLDGQLDTFEDAKRFVQSLSRN